MRRWLHGIALVLIVVLAVGLYKAKTDAARTRAHVRELESQIAESQSNMRALRAEIAQLESPARVEQLAQQRPGLRPGGESAALPETSIDQRLPAPRAQQTKSGH